MTEGRLVQHETPMCVRIWLEVGHSCEPRHSASGRALSLDWRVWVRGVAGQDISAFVHKVVFRLNPATEFVYPKRVRQEPPYEIQESGSDSIEIPIHVYLKYSSKPRRIQLKYSLLIENCTKITSESRCIYYDFVNPSNPLRRALMRGGGEPVAHAAGPAARAGALLVVLSDSGEERPPRRAPKHKCEFVEPVRAEPQAKYPRKTKCLLHDLCSKCEDASNVDLKSLLRRVSMSEDEIKQVSRLYASYSSYEQSRDALPLPPLSDPIYRVPELPRALRRALVSVEADLAMQ